MATTGPGYIAAPALFLGSAPMIDDKTRRLAREADEEAQGSLELVGWLILAGALILGPALVLMALGLL